MSYSYQKLHQKAPEIFTHPGEDRQPVYRREDIDGEPKLVVDHYISQQEMIESDRPLDIVEIVKRAMRGDPSVLGDGSRALYADVSHLGDINDLYDSAMAFKVASQQIQSTEQVETPVQAESEVVLNESLIRKPILRRLRLV